MDRDEITVEFAELNNTTSIIKEKPSKTKKERKCSSKANKTKKDADKTEQDKDEVKIAESNNTGVCEDTTQDKVGVNETLLGKAIKNQGKFFAEQNEKISYAIKHPYIKRDTVFTEAEKKLYRLMKAELNSKLVCIHKAISIFPKVRVADIIDVDPVLRDNKTYLYKITNKHIDYIICDESSLDIICAVELDDSYHYKDKAIERDTFINDTFRGCGIQLFRVDVPIKNIRSTDISNILDYVLDYFSPTCPRCGSLMTQNKSTRRYNFGHRFYGCNNWKPDGSGCNYSIDID